MALSSALQFDCFRPGQILVGFFRSASFLHWKLGLWLKVGPAPHPCRLHAEGLQSTVGSRSPCNDGCGVKPKGIHASSTWVHFFCVRRGGFPRKSCLPEMPSPSSGRLPRLGWPFSGAVDTVPQLAGVRTPVCATLKGCIELVQGGRTSIKQIRQR